MRISSTFISIVVLIVDLALLLYAKTDLSDGILLISTIALIITTIFLYSLNEDNDKELREKIKSILEKNETKSRLARERIISKLKKDKIKYKLVCWLFLLLPLFFISYKLLITSITSQTTHWVEYTNIAVNLVTTITIVIGATWFFITSKYKPRIQFDLACEIVEINKRNKTYVADIQIIITNRGHIDHLITNLDISILGLSNVTVNNKKSAEEAEFTEWMLKEKSIISKKHGSYFVRPNVSQTLRYTTKLKNPSQVLLIKARFNYDEKYSLSDDYHIARKVVRLPK